MEKVILWVTLLESQIAPKASYYVTSMILFRPWADVPSSVCRSPKIDRMQMHTFA